MPGRKSPETKKEQKNTASRRSVERNKLFLQTYIKKNQTSEL